MAIGINDYTIEFVISNAIGQSIFEANSVRIIVIVSMVGACGQGSGQLELELFIDRMVSAGTKNSCAGAILIVEIVENLLLNRGLFGLRRNWNVPVCVGNHQQEGIVGMIEIARIKWGSINDQIITCLVKMDVIATTTTFNGGFRGCIGIRVEIVAYNARKSDAVSIGIVPFADNLKNLLSSVSVGSVDKLKLSAKGRICFQLVQKSGRIISDVAAPRNVGNLKVFNIITLNITLEDLESAERVPCGDVPLSACKRRDRHGAQHGNCQQCGQQLFDCFLHHDLRKSPFKFF